MSLDRPIFIIGTGRCGSTIFHKIFTHHPHVCFLSGLCLYYPKRPVCNRWGMRMMDVPLVRRYARQKFRPAEHWPFWDLYLRGFSAPCRDLVAEDVRPNEVGPITNALEKMLTGRRRRMLVKLTGWPRTGYLQAMFPGARFVHVIRDGRAVVNSLLNVTFWQGWNGPAQCGLGELTPSEREEWDQSDRSFVTLAAIQWKRWMDAYENAKRLIPPAQYFEITYEDLAADPHGTFDEVLAFCGLEVTPKFHDCIRQFAVRSENDKWKSQLTSHQQRLLTESLRKYLVRYGYEEPTRPLAEATDSCATRIEP